MELNLVLLGNRETIFKYVQSLRIVLGELKTVADSYFNQADRDWNSLRYTHVISAYRTEIEEHLGVDFQAYYSRHQAIFNDFVGHTLKEVNWF